ncbi:hypothetical protein N7539_007858 [Penicillium diatomitis]|uniref:Uncharacterized protein n=1 Tax=Penicillium diatomitis TaxID=2819901 RepID=A0A9X0BND4_9EURO|nr:uncharacterized protein N7539_007858 [Penicillium diatomitis]KAJ5475571.1 hypothetical protein N7539_007858 [Penicillium diatomitis]
MKSGASDMADTSKIAVQPVVQRGTQAGNGDDSGHEAPGTSRLKFWSRKRQDFFNKLMENQEMSELITLSKLWVANIDSSLVVLTDIYTYIGIISEVLNEAFPRSAWNVIGDSNTRSMNARLHLAYTLIMITTTQGLILMIIFLTYPQSLASAFVPEKVRGTSIAYVRLSVVQFLSSAAEAALSSSTRALDDPDVPLVISSAKFVLNIILDLLLVSNFHVQQSEPTLITQGTVRVVCDMTSVTAGLLYFYYKVVRKAQREGDARAQMVPSWVAFMTLLRPSVYTFTESAIRNAIYLWLVNRIVQMGQVYATAWGVFNTIRWGLVMVPVQALESSTLVFVGHAWGAFRAASDIGMYPRASRKEVLTIIRPALVSCAVALIFETVICIALSVHGIKGFAHYLSKSDEVATVTQQMWRAIDWTYIFYAVNYQLAAILLAASPRWYLYQALGSNFLWMLPWAIVMTTRALSKTEAWLYYAIIFGGAMVFDFFNVAIVLCVWLWRVSRGKVRV